MPYLRDGWRGVLWCQHHSLGFGQVTLATFSPQTKELPSGVHNLTFKEIFMFTTFDQVDKAFEQMDKVFEDLNEVFDNTFNITKDITTAILSFAGELPTFPPVNVYVENFDVDPLTFLKAEPPIREYVIELALSGYKRDNVEVNVIKINGVKFLVIESAGINNKLVNPKVEWFHRGIAGRAFKMRFMLAQNVKVKSADLEEGLLSINLTIEDPVKSSIVQKVSLGKKESTATPGYAGDPP